MSIIPSWLSGSAAVAGLKGISALFDIAARDTGAGSHAVLELANGSEGGFLVEACPLNRAESHAAAWAQLSSRCLEPNPFMEPGFCLPAARHLAGRNPPHFLMVWRLDLGPEPVLVGVVPVARSGLPFRRLAAVWFHDLAALGTPMLDRDCAVPVLLAALNWVQYKLPDCGALLISALAADGPTARALSEAAERGGRQVRFMDQRRRAILASGSEAAPAGIEALSRRKAKEAMRQRRRLSEQGKLSYASAVDPEDVSAALELFLDLEARGWKGKRGTALGVAPPRAAFTRDMVTRMGQQGQCRIDALLLDGTPVAMGILFSINDQDFFWKTAYAENHAALSPGVQFVLELTRAQQQKTGFRRTDSCAVPDHSMIDRLWPNRLAIVDALLEITPRNPRRFGSVIAAETARRRARARLKAWLGRAFILARAAWAPGRPRQKAPAE